MYEVIKIQQYCVLLNQIKGSKTCKVEAMVGDGCMNETQQTAGISHLTEHVLTEAWKKCYKKGCAVFWKDYGVMINAETNNNFVGSLNCKGILPKYSSICIFRSFILYDPSYSHV